MKRILLLMLIIGTSSQHLLAQTPVILYRQGNIIATKKPKPVFAPFYFTNGSNPAISGNFVAGTATSATLTLVYINGNGNAYPAYTSTTVNGITLSTNAGTVTNSTGSIVFTASGVPVSPGNFTIPVSIAGSYVSNVPISVLNAPVVPGPCTDPASTIGSTGCVTFTYQGQQVTYATVRAADGNIWLQQNLGAPQAAFSGSDIASFGHYFQWGRWDDGHQLPNSTAINGSSTLQNPSHIASGNSNFIKSAATATRWWGAGGASSDTWSTAPITATNGKDPCSAIGAGWHVPTSGEWTNIMNLEFISDNNSAFLSNLKLTESGYHSAINGSLVPNFVGGYYWSSTASNGNTANTVFFDAAYNAFVTPMERGYGFNVRCVK
jgi:uncharacterized protein (TIGR02145 family)